MSLALYMDEHVQDAVTEGLRARGVDVMTVQEDGRGGEKDPAILDRALELGRVMFSQDADLLREANLRQRAGRGFAGLVYVHQLGCTVGVCILDLELLAKALEPEEIRNRVEYLPLR